MYQVMLLRKKCWSTESNFEQKERLKAERLPEFWSEPLWICPMKAKSVPKISPTTMALIGKPVPEINFWKAENWANTCIRKFHLSDCFCTIVSGFFEEEPHPVKILVFWRKRKFSFWPKSPCSQSLFLRSIGIPRLNVYNYYQNFFVSKMKSQKQRRPFKSFQLDQRAVFSMIWKTLFGFVPEKRNICSS